MTDAVREYRQWCEAEYEKHAAVTQRKADAAIAELQDKLDRAQEYARIEVKRKGEAVERECAAIERAEKAEAENEKLRNKQAFNSDWERMYCATGHERISYIGENCPLCAAKAEVEECEFQQATKSDKDRIVMLERELEQLKDDYDALQREAKHMYRKALEDNGELKDRLDKCEQQKRGLASAAKAGTVAGNRVIELEAEVERLKVCGSCDHWWSGLMGCAMDSSQAVVCEGFDHCKVFTQIADKPETREPCWTGRRRRP